MEKYLSKIIAIASLIFATSCASSKYMNIDVLQPAKIDFAKNIVNIGIVDNAGVVISEDSISGTIMSQEKKMEVITSKSKDVFLGSLVDFLEEEKFFNQVTLYPTTMRTDKNYGILLPLMKSTIQDIATEIDADAIVILEAFDSESRKKLVSENGWMYTITEANANIMFRVYDRSGTAMSPIMATSDTLSFPGNFLEEMKYHNEIALKLSESTIKQLIPYWETQERIYYTDGTNLMKTANKLAEKAEWADAAKVWGAAFEAETKEIRKAKIAVNIALANEYLGDIGNAVEWIRIASNTMGQKTTTDEYNYIRWYKIKLLERQKNNPKVLNQMGVEENENTKE